MKRIRSAGVVVLALMLGAAAASDALPTMDELKSQLDGNPTSVLRGVARLLALKGEAAKPYNRYDVLSLRGEAHLRTRAFPLAADDFAAAAKETDDEAKKSLARATEILIRRCKPNGYMPGAGTTQPTLPMRIFTPAERKEALETLLADARVVAAPKLKAAGFAQEVQGVLAIGPTCADLRALEIAVTGKADETRTAASGLAARAHATVSPVIDLMVTRTDDIRAAAAQERTHRMAYSNAQVAWDHVGLDADDQRRLHIILDTSDDFTRNAGALAAASENADLAADVARTKKLAERAKSMLDYNWHTAQPIPESVGN